MQGDKTFKLTGYIGANRREGHGRLMRRWGATNEAYHRAIRSSGRDPYTTASRPCACGKPALYTWKNIGYCKTHKPERV